MPRSAPSIRLLPARLVARIRREKVVGIRAGRAHRIIGIWAVVVDDRVFVRSWGVKPGGWFHAFLVDPNGIIDVAGRRHRIRAVRTRSERIKDAVSQAYREKYNTPGSLKYVRDLSRATCRQATLELVVP